VTGGEWNWSGVGSVGAVIVLIGGLYLAIQRGWLIVGRAHSREVATLDNQLTRQSERHATEVNTVRGENREYVAQLIEHHTQEKASLRQDIADARAAFALVLASKDKDIDQWRSAWHLTDQGNREEIAGALDEILQGQRAQQNFIAGVQQAYMRKLSNGDDGPG
jgi:hypothetical protein